MAAQTRDIAGYTDAQLIGRGGFASVYRATDAAHGRDVAIKVLEGSLGEAERRRFDRERQTMGRLGSHPNIVPVHESGYTESGEGYIVMQLASGGSLRDRLEKDGRISWSEALPIMAAVAQATQAAHDSGVLHRDIKPDNILIDQYGNPKLSDFGIAAVASNATATTSTTATLAHAAPELLQGERSSEAMDIYAIGSTLHALLTGLPPFLHRDDEGVTAMITRALTEPPPDLRSQGVPDQVATVIERALSKNPADRQATAAELATELKNAAEGKVVQPLAGGSSGGVQTVVEPRPINQPPGPGGNPFSVPSPPPLHHSGQPVGHHGTGQPSAPFAGSPPPRLDTPNPSPPPQFPPAVPQAFTSNPTGNPAAQQHSGPFAPQFQPAPAKSSGGRTAMIALAAILVLAGAAGVWALVSNGDDDGTGTQSSTESASGANSEPSRAEATDSSGTVVTVSIDCPSSIPLDAETFCTISSTNAESGEWNLPGFLSEPEEIETVNGNYEIFLQPSNPEAVNQTFTIMATVVADDGTEAIVERQFTVVDTFAEIDCPDEIQLNTSGVCTITASNAVEGEWSIPEFGSGELEFVPGDSPITIEPSNSAAVGRTFTLTATVRDADGTTYTASQDFAVTDG